MIDAYQPTTIGETPTNATLLDEASKPSPDIGVLGVRLIRGAFPNPFFGIQHFPINESDLQIAGFHSNQFRRRASLFFPSSADLRGVVSTLLADVKQNGQKIIRLTLD